MKRILLFLALAVLLLSFVACDTVPVVPEPDKAGKLLEFPGLQWNMSPEAIIEALNLQDGDVQEASEYEHQEGVYLLDVKGESLGDLFGGKVDSASFWCYDDHEGENAGAYGLAQITLTYTEDTDMSVVREKITERYGTEKPFQYFSLEEEGGWKTYREFAGFEPAKLPYDMFSHQVESSEHQFYWASEKKMGDILSDDVKAGYLEQLMSVHNTIEDFPESFETMMKEHVAVYIQMIDGPIWEKSWAEDEDPITTKRVMFDARYLVWPMQKFGDSVAPVS